MIGNSFVLRRRYTETEHAHTFCKQRARAGSLAMHADHRTKGRVRCGEEGARRTRTSKERTASVSPRYKVERAGEVCVGPSALEATESWEPSSIRQSERARRATETSTAQGASLRVF